MAGPVVEQRRICWPNPDSACLEGSCWVCNHGHWVSYEAIESYIERHPYVRERSSGGRRSSRDAWEKGRATGWPRVEKRTRTVPAHPARGQCRMVAADGRACRGLAAWGLCHVHDPDSTFARNRPAYREQLLAHPVVIEVLAARESKT